MVCNHYATLILLQVSKLRLEEVKLPEVAVGSTMPQVHRASQLQTPGQITFFSSSPPCHSGNWAEFRPSSETQGVASAAGRTARKEALILACSYLTLKEVHRFKLTNFIF